MLLHEAIAQVLREKKKPMTTQELADEINSRKLYRRKDGSAIEPNQISARVSNHPELFIRVDGEIRLIGQEILFNLTNLSNTYPFNNIVSQLTWM